MQRRSFLKWTMCGWLGLLAVNSPAQARKTVPSMPVPVRMALADLVILGKVTAIEGKSVSAIPFRDAKEAVSHQIAVVQVEEVLHGVQGVTNVRIGFAFPPNNLENGKKYRFFLQKHGTESFFVPDERGVKQADGSFAHNFTPSEKEGTLIKQCARLLADPDAGLKSKDADERHLTAAMLVLRYRTQRTPKAKTEPVDAEQSRLILQALADYDWLKADSFPSPFDRLNLTEKDGWKPPHGATQQQYLEKAQQWLKANAGTYRLQRFVEAD